MMRADDRYVQSTGLFAAAKRLIPGGVHLSGRPLLDSQPSPLYFQRGRGCRIWDADGHEYIDYLMAYGALVLGYANEAVDSAAFEQARQGSLLSLNHPLHLRFVEALLRRFPGAEMAVLLKTGSEATTAAVRVARRYTGRRKIARCGYHGWHDWCLPDADFVPAELAPQVPSFDARRPETLAALLDAEPGAFAAVIVAPEMLRPLDREALEVLRDQAHRHGAVFIMDEVKTAFRTRPGSIQRHLDLTPDLTTVSKALGNGWPVAALVGRREVMQAAAGLHLSATYHGDTAAMAAAMATMEIIDREGVQDHVWDLGQRLIDGLNAAAARHKIPAQAYGEPLPPMPFFAFTHDDASVNEALRVSFYSQMLAQGILLHPRHLWFISQAHTEADIDQTLAAADAALAVAANLV